MGDHPNWDAIHIFKFQQTALNQDGKVIGELNGLVSVPYFLTTWKRQKSI